MKLRVNEKIGYDLSPGEMEREYLLYANSLGYLYDNPRFYIRRKGFSGYLFMACLSGTLHMEQYEKKRTLSAPKCCMLDLTKPHYYYSDEKDPCEILWIHIDGKAFGQLYPLLQPKNDILFFENEEIRPIIRKCLAIVQSDQKGYEYTLSALIYQLVISVVKSVNNLDLNLSPEDDEFSDRFDEYVLQNMANRITLDQLAAYFHLDKAYLCRKVKMLKGVSPLKYVSNKKMQIAKFRVAYTNDSIQDISDSLGFSNPNYLSSLFYKSTGSYPLSYRKGHNG